jgi:hypothetical protein
MATSSRLQISASLPLALVGLCLHLEHGLDGKGVQAAHMALARTREQWPLLMAPGSGYPVLVNSVLGSESAAVRAGRLEAWASSTWNAWRGRHEWVRSVIRRHRLVA